MNVFPKNVVVTGVAGFLGSNLLSTLVSANHSVIGIDNLSMGRMENIQPHIGGTKFRFLQRDITDRATLVDLPGDIDCVVHLAAFKIPRYGNTLDTLRINAIGTTNVLDFAKDRGCKVVLASTSDVYGKSTKIPFAEDDDLVVGPSDIPRWAYAVSKLFDEHLALAYQESFGFPVTLLRFFGSYGPNMHLSWWGGPPPVFIDAVLNDEEIPIHGDGQQTRSFTYVSDTVAGIYAAILRSEANGQIINIGSTHEVTILELAKRIKKLSGTPGELKCRFVPYESFTGKKYDDVLRRVPDITRCKRLLGVEAQVSLDEGLRMTIDWQKGVREAQRSVMQAQA